MKVTDLRLKLAHLWGYMTCS